MEVGLHNSGGFLMKTAILYKIRKQLENGMLSVHVSRERSKNASHLEVRGQILWQCSMWLKLGDPIIHVRH